MSLYPKRHSRRNRYCCAYGQLDLFLDSAPPAVPALLPSTLAETRLAQRFGVSLALARVYAELASLGGRA